LWLFGIPASIYGGQPDSEPVVILYNDSTGTIGLSDLKAQPLPNNIFYHMMHVILPKKYNINIELKPIMWVQGCCFNFRKL